MRGLATFEERHIVHKNHCISCNSSVFKIFDNISQYSIENFNQIFGFAKYLRYVKCGNIASSQAPRLPSLIESNIVNYKGCKKEYVFKRNILLKNLSRLWKQH